ncbi:MAG: LD-carboxypeptidase [Muribaculum sp.]|nr:LD-carboxypeptidase [Muribaculum sp.]
MIYPDKLAAGDKVALVSVATKVKKEYVEGAERWFADHGMEPVVMPYAAGSESGSFASLLTRRINDFMTALLDPEIKCIFCNRGGYGVQQILPVLNTDVIAKNPKWLVGFSDISALHAAWARAGVMSLHAPMAKHLTLHPDDYCSDQEYRILCGETPGGEEGYRAEANILNFRGEAAGILIGGNAAVLNGLASTPFDVLTPDFAAGKILFLEDIGENIYEIDRILTRLYMAGTLQSAAGLIFGHFTDYGEDLNYATMEEMIHHRLQALGIHLPTAFGFPAGHKDDNLPLILGAEVSLRVNEEGTVLKTNLP